MRNKTKWTLIFLLAVPPSAIGVYYCCRFAFYAYFDSWGKKIVTLENEGLLSNRFGAGWTEVLAENAMEEQAKRITNDTEAERSADILKTNGVSVNDFPSLSVIARLNEISRYSNSIAIVDHKDRPIATIRTDHNRARLDEIPGVLVESLIASEDKNFPANKHGVEFAGFIRAVLVDAWESVRRFRLEIPRGTSTITQQVAKLFISRLDVTGRRSVERSVERKLREMRLASAIRRMYSNDQILEVYLNHCITSDYGLIGVKDIAEGLFGRKLSRISDAQCVYIARMVKWGRNVPQKIIRQCRADMPKIAAALGWDKEKQREVLAQIDSLTFKKPQRVNTEFGPLVDLANEYWLLILRRKGLSEEQIANMDLINPYSLIRKKGTCRIKLNIDLPLQRELERLVDGRGYGRDTTIVADVRIGSSTGVVSAAFPPRDTLRAFSIVTKPTGFSEAGSLYTTTLTAGDTLVANIRYKKIGAGKFRRSCYYYTRRAMDVGGQYFAYAVIDSKSGELLAYYSRDRLGSRLIGFLKNRIPNGSSTAKPIFNALNFDWGDFKPYGVWNDSVEVTADVPWKRTFEVKNGKTAGVIFASSSAAHAGYEVHNHGWVFEGCRYIFDLLASSNNILGVENVYKLDRQLFDASDDIRPEAAAMAGFFYRIADLDRLKDGLHLNYITGVRVYKELARIAGADADSMVSGGRRIPLSDDAYSVGLGTLELNLCEQAHLFNTLYNNDIIEEPARHPSLVIGSVMLNGDSVIADDTIKRYHPFSDLNNLRPTWLGMHKRLVSNPADGLRGFDVFDGSMAKSSGMDGKEFSEDVLRVSGPVSNYAKSGTTDDVIRPFNVGGESNKRTNYGLWNAVLRLDFSKLSGDPADSAFRDVTLACVGECNRKFTGEPDGKSLHKFVSIGLLKKAGVAYADGFFKRYEAYLKSVPADSFNNCAKTNKAPSENQE